MSDVRRLLLVTVCLRQSGRDACPARWIPQSVPANYPRSGSSGPAACRTASSSNARQDSDTCCSKASLPTTATATPSTPAGPAGSPRHSGLPCALPRSMPPGSTTMQDSARTATLSTATATGTCPRADTATAPAATGRAWIRTGRRQQSITCRSRLSRDKRSR
jgi:hypothetical protein